MIRASDDLLSELAMNAATAARQRESLTVGARVEVWTANGRVELGAVREVVLGRFTYVVVDLDSGARAIVDRCAVRLA
jgi:hypothetical protein